MTKWISGFVWCAAVLWVGSGYALDFNGAAQDSDKSAKGCSACDYAGCSLCESYCCGSGCVSWEAGAEAVFLRLSQVDGVRGGASGTAGSNASNADFDFDITPRITLARIGPGGVGVRARFWDYSHNDSTANGQLVTVDTWLLDLEVFERIDLSCCTTVEWSAGVRLHDFEFDRGSSGPDLYTLDDAIGGVVGVQINRNIWRGDIYTRARGGIVVADQGHLEEQGVVATDLIRSQTELALGYELAQCTSYGVWRINAGYEWHFWDSYVAANVGGGDEVLVGLGFDGFHVGLALER